MPVEPRYLIEKLREIEQQARLVLDEMIAAPSLHRARLLHVLSLAQELQTHLASFSADD